MPLKKNLSKSFIDNLRRGSNNIEFVILILKFIPPFEKRFRYKTHVKSPMIGKKRR